MQSIKDKILVKIIIIRLKEVMKVLFGEIIFIPMILISLKLLFWKENVN